MAGYIPQNLLDEILNKIDITELIAGYFPLKRAGRNFKALCPFHHEKTPSFMVNPQRQIFHCFGCGKGGNAFSFLMEYEHMDFMEAVRTLASKAGVVLPQPGTESRTSGLISTFYKINEWACVFYQNNLNSQNAAFARDYLDKRGISNESIRIFRLGLSLDRWDSLLNYLRSRNVSLSHLEKSGLVCARPEAGYYDRFRKRLIFAISDVKNRVVAFGARLLSEDKTLAKYINSPESLIYVKGRHLYGLNLSGSAIRQNDCAIVVEGYFDCITVYQAGIKNVVASLGTSLTIDQIRLLKRYTHNIVMVYDADQAGQEAVLRNLDILIQEAMNIRVVPLPPGFDPDSFVCKFGAEAFTEKINNAKDLFEYKFDFLTSRYEPKKPEAKAYIVQEMLTSLNNLKDAVLQSEYLRRLAQMLDIKEEALFIELRKVRDKRIYIPGEFIKTTSSKINPTERLFMNLILRETELISQLKQELEPDDFQDTRIGRVFSLICELVAQGKAIEAHRLIGYLNDQESVSLISELLAVDEGLPHNDTELVLNDCVSRIKNQRLNLKCQSLQEQIKRAQRQGDHEQLNRLVAEFRDLQHLRASAKEVKWEKGP
jgi:DNA primase